MTSIDAEATAATFDDFLQALGGSLASLVEITRTPERSLDVADLDTDELKQAIRGLIEDIGQQVTVAWPADNTAARVSYRDMLERIDDLWYPSMDDLVVIDSRDSIKRILVLDHEERLFTSTLTT